MRSVSFRAAVPRSCSRPAWSTRWPTGRRRATGTDVSGDLDPPPAGDRVWRNQNHEVSW